MKIKKIVISLFILLISISYSVYADATFDNSLRSYLVTIGASESNIEKVMKCSDIFYEEAKNSNGDFFTNLIKKSRENKDLEDAMTALNVSATGTTSKDLLNDFYGKYNTQGGATKIQEEVKGTVTYQDNPSVYTGSSTTSKSSSSQSSSSRSYSNTTTTGSNTGFSLDDIMKQAQNFSDAIKQGQQKNSGGFLDLSGLFGKAGESGIIGMIFTIGNLVMLASIVFMGLRYVWSGASRKI